mgnify:CR=1 FL=1
MRKKKRRKKSRIIWITILLSLALYVGTTIYQQAKEMAYLDQQKKMVEEEIQRIEEEIESLNKQLEKSDEDEHIEKVAREKLKMIGSDEILIIDTGDQ